MQGVCSRDVKMEREMERRGEGEKERRRESDGLGSKWRAEPVPFFFANGTSQVEAANLTCWGWGATAGRQLELRKYK